MAKVRAILRSLLIWTHERGTLQYDIICALILAFIFLVPKSCFTAKKALGPFPVNAQTTHQAPPAHPEHP